MAKLLNTLIPTTPHNSSIRSNERLASSKRRLSESLTVVIPLSTRLTKPNFFVSLRHMYSCSVRVLLSTIMTFLSFMLMFYVIAKVP